MLRRAAAGVILGVSLFVASLAWSSFIALQTVFDPDRSQQIADDLWEDDAVRAQLADNVAGAAATMVPEGVEVDEAVLQSAAASVVESPVLRQVVNAAFVDTHRAFLGEGDLPAAIEIGEISQIVRSALVAAQPDLEPVLPAAPDVRIDLPTDRIPDASPVRNALQVVVPIFALVAAVGIAVALLTTTSRPAVLRRAGVWAVTASAFVVVVSLGVPWLVARLAPSQAEVLAAFVSAIFAAAFTPSIVLGALGLVAIVVSFVWRAGQAVRSDTPPVREAVPRRAEAPVAAAPRGGATGVMHLPATSPQAAPPPVASHLEPLPARDAPDPRAAAPAAAARSSVETEPRNDAPEPALVDDAPPGWESDAPAPRWVPGVGWVQHPDDTRPPEGARWEPGIGYILDRPADPLQD